MIAGIVTAAPAAAVDRRNVRRVNFFEEGGGFMLCLLLSLGGISILFLSYSTRTNSNLSMYSARISEVSPCSRSNRPGPIQK